MNFFRDLQYTALGWIELATAAVPSQELGNGHENHDVERLVLTLSWVTCVQIRAPAAGMPVHLSVAGDQRYCTVRY